MEDYKKKYEEALDNFKKIKEANKDNNELVNFIEYEYPELKESKDERIRKFLYDFINNIPPEEWNKDKPNEDFRITILDWLEKQGEQDTDISSFSKEQQMLMQKYVSLDKITLIKLLAERDASNAEIIESFEKQGEQKQHLELKAGHWYFCHQAYCERADILTVKEGETFKCEKDGIVKGLIIKEPEKYFREISTPIDKVEPKFKVGDVVRNISNGDTVTITQIDKENQFYNYSGWDGVATVHSDFSIYEQDNWELVEQKPAWSKENSCYYDDICEILINLINSPTSNVNKDAIQKDLDWLMSIGESQLKSAWSEKDENMLQKALSTIRYALSIPADKENDTCFVGSSTITWLKSLKERMKGE